MQMCSTKYVYTNLAKKVNIKFNYKYLRLFWQVISKNAQKAFIKIKAKVNINFN